MKKIDFKYKPKPCFYTGRCPFQIYFAIKITYEILNTEKMSVSKMKLQIYSLQSSMKYFWKK